MALDATFRALGDETRRAIICRLADGELGLSELAKPFNLSQTGVSKHVGILRKAGLLDVEKRGRIRYCKLNGAALKDASDWLDDYAPFWTNQIENLTTYLNEQNEDQP